MRNRTIVRGSRQLLLASFAAASGAALAGCVGPEDAGSELLGEAQQAATVCVHIQRGVGTSVVKDILIYEESGASHNGTDMYAGVRVNNGTGYAQRSLLQFDLSSIPPNATIISADVTLYIGSGGPELVNVHRVERPAGSSPTWTWGEADASGMWSGLSTAFNPTIEASFSPNPSTTSSAAVYNIYRTFSVTGLVQRWVDGVYPNHGLMLRLSSGRTHIRTSEMP